MFDISWSEFLLIGIVALIVIGPKELPTVMRTLGQWTRKVRAMAAEFQDQFQEAMREAEVADLKNEVDDLARKVRTADPIKSVREDFETMGHDFQRALDSGPEGAAPAPESAVPPDSAADAAAGSETGTPETGSVAPEGAETSTTHTETPDPGAQPEPASESAAPGERGAPASGEAASPPSPPQPEPASESAAPVERGAPADATGHSG